jgi:hypothetical protein
VHGDQQFAVANFYLPPQAAGNVLLGSWLAANTTSSSTSSVVTTTHAPKPMTFADILNRPITVDVVQEDLHVAVSLIEEAANQGLPPGSEKLSIKLVGNDLEKAGITQNQAVRNFQQTNLPVRAVLTAICLKAHTPTLTNPKDPAQRLVWAVGPDPTDSQRQSVLITTRTAAQRYKLAPEFGE